MLSTHKINRNTNRSPKARDQRKNKLESDLQVEVTGRNAKKGKN